MGKIIAVKIKPIADNAGKLSLTSVAGEERLSDGSCADIYR